MPYVHLIAVIVMTLGVCHGHTSIARVFFMARRYAKCGICRRRRVSVSVSVCVCPSVTLRYCTKSDKRRITPIMPHDSPETLVF